MKIKNVKVFSFVFIALLISSFSVLTFAQMNSESGKNIFQDSDQDGLSNDEEMTFGTDPRIKDTDGDGYSDGAEVKSGYDPLIPAPGDKLAKDVAENVATAVKKADEENMTEQFSSKVAGIIKENSLEKVSIENIDDAISQTISEKADFNGLPEIDPKTIKIKKQKYSSLSQEQADAKRKEDSLEYLTAVSYIVANNLPQELSGMGDLDSFYRQISINSSSYISSFTGNEYIDKLAEKQKDITAQMNALEVPADMLDIHKKGLQLAAYSGSLKEELKPSPDDPIATIVNLAKVKGFLMLVSNFSNEVEGKIIGAGIAEIPLGL